MQTQTSPTSRSDVCCQPFDPATWQDKEVTWNDKPFVTDRVHSFLHMPLNMGRRVTKNMQLIEAAGANPSDGLMLSEERSPWSSDLYIDVTKPVPGARMAALSGTFMTHVYEGPFRDAPKWIADMRERVETSGRALEKIFLAYTTCPRCAKKYGKNYVVLFAKLAEPDVACAGCE